MLLAEIASEKPLITWTFLEQTSTPNVNQKLTVYQQEGVRTILTKYKDVFSEKPGRTNAAQITINTGDAKPVYLPPYRLPATRVGVVQEESDNFSWQVSSRSQTVHGQHQWCWCRRKIALWVVCQLQTPEQRDKTRSISEAAD